MVIIGELALKCHMKAHFQGHCPTCDENKLIPMLCNLLHIGNQMHKINIRNSQPQFHVIHIGKAKSIVDDDLCRLENVIPEVHLLMLQEVHRK